MSDVAALLEEDVPLQEARIAVDADAFAAIREAVASGTDAWVAAVVTDAADRVLLVRNAWSDGWVPPGGDVEDGESLREAAAREVREETGVEAAVGDPLAVVAETFACEGRTVTGHRVVFAAAAETTDPAADPGLDGEGIEAVAWFDALPARVEQRALVEGWCERATGRSVQRGRRPED